MVDVTIEPREAIAIASIMARRGVTPLAVSTALGGDVPHGPGRTGTSTFTVIGTGPASWLAIADPAPGDWVGGLRTRLGNLASVSDQSGGYAVFRIAGADARRLLQRGVAIDLHPTNFGPTSAVVTTIAHIGVILWQMDARPSYELAVFRSYAFSLQRWLDSNLLNLET